MHSGACICHHLFSQKDMALNHVNWKEIYTENIKVI